MKLFFLYIKKNPLCFLILGICDSTRALQSSPIYSLSFPNEEISLRPELSKMPRFRIHGGWGYCERYKGHRRMEIQKNQDIQIISEKSMKIQKNNKKQ